MARKILILAGDTDGNLGDLAIVTATCQQLRSVHPDARISLLTSHPERDAQRLGITPLRRGLCSVGSLVNAARQADLVICGGGGLFQDDDSLLKMPYWALRLLVLRLFSKRIVGLSIGAGPLRHPVSRFFGRLALKTLDPVTVRDPLARAVLQPLTRKRIDVVPDPAFMLKAAAAEPVRQMLIDAGVPLNKPLVGVALRRWFHTSSNIIPHKYAAMLGLGHDRGESSMALFREYTASVLASIVSQTGAHVVFLPTYNVRHENDAAVCEAIGSALSAGSYSMLCLDDPALYKAVTGLVSVMLCGRMHPAILAASQGTPVVGLSYNQKFSGMFSLLGQGARCVSLIDFITNNEAERVVAMLRESIQQPGCFRPDTVQLENETRRFVGSLVVAVSPADTGVAEPQTQQR